MPPSILSQPRPAGAGSEALVAPGEGILDFLASLRWLDGTPLLDQVEPYRREIFVQALDSHVIEPKGGRRRKYNLVLAGRGKKNAKTLDLCLAGLHVLVSKAGPRGQTCYVLASDEGQAGDDLDLIKKLIEANPKVLGAKLTVRRKTITRKDGKGFLEVLPAQTSR